LLMLLMLLLLHHLHELLHVLHLDGRGYGNITMDDRRVFLHRHWAHR
jgi:hypothetical protein